MFGKVLRRLAWIPFEAQSRLPQLIRRRTSALSGRGERTRASGPFSHPRTCTRTRCSCPRCGQGAQAADERPDEGRRVRSSSREEKAYFGHPRGRLRLGRARSHRQDAECERQASGRVSVIIVPLPLPPELRSHLGHHSSRGRRLAFEQDHAPSGRRPLYPEVSGRHVAARSADLSSRAYTRRSGYR